MKLRIDTPVLNFDNSVIELVKTAEVLNQNGSVKIPAVKENLTFRTILETAINADVAQHPLTTEQQVKLFRIGTKLLGRKRVEYELTLDEVVFLKERVGFTYRGPLVYGRFLELINDLAVEDDKEDQAEVSVEARKRHK